jgi:DNA polymerase-3 subunit epsilon
VSFEWPQLALKLHLERPLVGFDVETTGKSPDKDRIVQLGFIRIEPDGETEEQEIIIDPEIMMTETNVKIHGITNEMVIGAPKFKTLVPKLNNVFTDVDICGYNVAFDGRFLRAEFKRCGVEWKPNRVIDPYKIFQTMETRTLTDAVRFYLDEELANAHSALPDTRAAMRVLHAQLKRYDDLPDNTSALHEFIWNHIPEGYLDPDRKIADTPEGPRLAFGKKHPNKLLSQVPSDYLQWIFGAQFNKHVKRIVNEELKKR